jgi:hypothetical protein
MDHARFARLTGCATRAAEVLFRPPGIRAETRCVGRSRLRDAPDRTLIRVVLESSASDEALTAATGGEPAAAFNPSISGTTTTAAPNLPAYDVDRVAGMKGRTAIGSVFRS